MMIDCGQIMTKRLLIALFSFVALALGAVGCTTTTASVDFSPLPTLRPTPTTAVNLQDVQRVSVLFLEAWQRNDMDAMYDLISVPSRETTSLDQFRALYDATHNEMTLDRITYQAKALRRTGPNSAGFTYDVTFYTNNLGDFSDTDRTLTLVIDPVADVWRVAWSPGDIFAEMGDGARLELAASVPRRANIYDRNGVVLADQNGVYVQVRVIPEDIPDYAPCINGLAAVTNRSSDVVAGIIERSGANWVVDVGSTDPTTYRAYQDQLQRDCDASFAQLSVRQYPPRSAALAHILGNVGYPTPDHVEQLIQAGYEADTIIGQSGIERSMDEILRGKPGGRLSLISRAGQRLRTLAQATSQPPESVWLSIDAALQEYVLRTMGEAYADARASWAQTSDGGAAVVMDVRTGEILALVSYPRYEGNAFNPFPAVGRETAADIQAEIADDTRNPLLNRATQGLYPVGSTMKVVDAIAVQEENVYIPEQAYYCSGVWEENGDQRFDWLAGGHGRMTTRTALTNSCNPFFYEVGFLLNERDPFLLPSYARRLGLGAATGLQGVEEAAGLIPDPEYIRLNRGYPWTYSDAVNMAIGQGEMQVTPLQMARMYAGIANGGTLYTPQLVLERGILDQRTDLAKPEIGATFDVRESVLDLVHAGLCDVTFGVNGTAAHIFRFSPLEDIGVCGKTGTAQASGAKPPHSWFIAYAPQDDPEIVVAMIIENSGDGSAVAAPLVRRVLEYYFFGPFD